MPAQTEYYNQFGAQHKAAILACKEPHLWTTDYHRNGVIAVEMTKRVRNQEHFIDAFFDSSFPVLDIGCGFGRQAFLLAKKGFVVYGIDTSDVFVNIARELFAKHRFEGRFECVDLMKKGVEGTFRNVLLFDVLEHIIPFKRRKFITRIATLTAPKGIVIVSLPHERNDGNWKKWIKQFIPYYTNKEEHPFLIPDKKNVENLINGLFTIEDSLRTEETDYYVLKRC